MPRLREYVIENAAEKDAAFASVPLVSCSKSFGWDNEKNQRDLSDYRGSLYMVVVPAHGYADMSVVIDEPESVPLLFGEDEEIPAGQEVEFDNLSVRVYAKMNNGGLGLAGTATGVRKKAAARPGRPAATAEKD